ncbi:MAG TPA: META domain-containing protein [Terriglobales bacterium]|nr:META domain-containing protein [Terriglobales bacterium]
MRKLSLQLAILAVLALVLSACASSSSSLVSTQWTLTSLNGGDVSSASASITIQFDLNGQVGGSAGCNSYGGSYSANADGGITFSQIVSTLMACMDETVMNNEMAFLQALNGVNHYEISGEVLRLSDGDQQLVFERSN